MFHLNEAFYHEEMPARAKRLFVKTFKKYHKLDGGDEDVALHMAKQAVDREYVKLNNRWIPKTAAEEIVRHDLDDDSLSESEQQQQQQSFTSPSQFTRSRLNVVGVRKNYNNINNRTVDDNEYLSESDQDFSDDDDDEDYDDEDVEYTKRSAYRAKNRKLAVRGGGIEKSSGRRSVINKNNKLAFK
ncbi:ChaB1 [Spodoptera eridania nucleopolyhedrovirus]|uniref:ChaB1 n=1 Tax=Spodoptera eridania nucleopolyhedrovirus TaxID=2315721 RepID=A0A346TQ38_9ABAC|nr:ChaB1 [Spodoptera eridania nucleopolyhedrovirus]AXU41698.1 ChaB1 [Spodoptera eridania nucleopolyhedrovirus]